MTNGSTAVAEVTSSGTTGSNSISSTNGAAGGVNAPVAVMVDGNGHVWVANSGNSSVSQFNAGSAISGSDGITGSSSGVNAPTSMSLDASGNVWLTNSNVSGAGSVTQIIGSAGPVVVPATKAINNNQLGVKP